MGKRKLTAENYFSPEMNKRYVGSSQFKSFMECPHSAYAEMVGDYVRPKTKALLMGSYFDAMFDGTLASFVISNPEIFTKKEPKTPLADYKLVEQIYQRVSRDDVWMKAATGEQQVVFTGEICGVPVKVMVDSMHPDRIVDRKLMKDFQGGWKNGMKLPWWQLYGYDIQGAIYREIVRQNTGEVLPFEIAAATKEKETETGDLKTDFDLFRFTDAELAPALQYVEENIVAVAEMKQGIRPLCRCNECKYCRQTKVLTGYRLFDSIEI